MTDPTATDLRALIAATVRDVVAELVTDSVRGAPQVPAGTGWSQGGPAPAPAAASRTASLVAVDEKSAQRQRVESVRIGDDRDLELFARHLLELFENPKNRQDLKAGRYRFTLAPAPRQASVNPAAARRVESGAVTERQVTAAAETGERIVLGRRAVLTPLARDRARSLGVEIEKER